MNPPGTKNLLPDALDFLALLSDFRLVQRTLLCRGSDIEENDVEHSYQLAMLAWYLIGKAKLDLDIGKTIRFALVHDFPEVYAGDTPVFGPNAGTVATKHVRESEALERLEKEWGSRFPEFISAIKEYESKESEEAKFIYALDKIIAPMNVYLDGGRNWKRLEVTLDMTLENKRPKVKGHAVAADFFEELAERLTKDKHLFYEPE
ncbi:HD domain-containing protein [Candidatus Parcubacteria bacterium]|nr:HD domain-containing protein [Candidatus Parcubacteria bacterium]